MRPAKVRNRPKEICFLRARTLIAWCERSTIRPSSSMPCGWSPDTPTRASTAKGGSQASVRSTLLAQRHSVDGRLVLACPQQVISAARIEMARADHQCWQMGCFRTEYRVRRRASTGKPSARTIHNPGALSAAAELKRSKYEVRDALARSPDWSWKELKIAYGTCSRFSVVRLG